jgi:hypothetical protein
MYAVVVVGAVAEELLLTAAANALFISDLVAGKD